jgi:hypothetical protein
MNGEIWKDIRGFEGRYQVSNIGRVRYPDTWITRPYSNGTIVTIRTRKAGYKQLINRDGYVTVALNAPGVKYTPALDKLVAEHFCEDYQDGMEIDHIDGDTTNNRVDNLRCHWFDNLPGEEWKPIKGFEGLYEVSNMGRVLSLPRISIHGNKAGGTSYIPVPKRLLYLNKLKNGYVHVVLLKNGKRHDYALHRLVALHFCDGYKHGLVVNHKNEIKTDCRALNLEWCTEQYNHSYGTARERTAKANWKGVAQYDRNGKLIATYNSGKEASEKTGFHRACISDWCRGAHPCKAGYIWRFL